MWTWWMYLSFLIATAVVTLELVVTTECFCVWKTFEAVGNWSILINVNLKIKEILILARNSLTIKATSFWSQNALENFMYPRRFWWCASITSTFSSSRFTLISLSFIKDKIVLLLCLKLICMLNNISYNKSFIFT